MNNYTYLTLLGSDNYLRGVLGLWKSLINQNSKYPLTVMVTNQVSENSIMELEKRDISYLKADKVEVSEDILTINAQNGFSNWTNTFSKLLIFGLTQFDKIVFLDADMLVLENIDELFGKDNLSATVAGKSVPGNENWVDLNSGMMVIVPKLNEDKRLISLISKFDAKSAFGDQDIISEGYSHWKEHTNLVLGEEYNILAKYEPYYVSSNVLDSPIKVLHFIGKVKPWNMSKYEQLKYCARLCKIQINKTRTLRGVFTSIKDFNKYIKICKNA